MIESIKTAFAIVAIFGMPFIIGYVSGLTQPTDWRVVLILYIIFIVMFTLGVLVKYKFGS